MMNFKTGLAWIGILCLVACNADKGNYDYKEIDKVTAVKNLNTAYTVELGDTLIITPEVETSLGGLDDFDYTWYYEVRSGGWVEWNVLQEGKDLNFEIATPIGTPNTTYTCAFEAKNRNTGVAYRRTFTVRVAGAFNRGYVLVCEQENGFDLNMVVQNLENQYEVVDDILASTAPSLPREGVKARDISIIVDPSAPNPYHADGSNRAVYLLTDKYTTRLRIADFTWDPSYDISSNVESSSPLYNDYVAVGKPIIAEKIEAGFYTTTTGRQTSHIYMYMKDDSGKGNWYLNNNFPVWYFFSFPMNGYQVRDKDNKVIPLESKRYEPAPYLSCGRETTLFFDTETNKFCYQLMPETNAMGTSFFFTNSVSDTRTDGIFNFEEENAGLFYMGERFTSVGDMEGFAILKQKDNTLKYIEYEMEDSSDKLVAATNKLRACIFDVNSQLDKAKFIAAPPKSNNSFLYYATEDNRVFYADISGRTAVVKEITDKVMKEGYDEITAFKFFVPNATDKSLGIATYNSALGEEGGRLDFYAIQSATSGELTLATYEGLGGKEDKLEMSWDGFGKIVSMDYKP